MLIIDVINSKQWIVHFKSNCSLITANNVVLKIVRSTNNQSNNTKVFPSYPHCKKINHTKKDGGGQTHHKRGQLRHMENSKSC
jgi:hypothetical protein